MACWKLGTEFGHLMSTPTVLHSYLWEAWTGGSSHGVAGTTSAYVEEAAAFTTSCKTSLQVPYAGDRLSHKSNHTYLWCAWTCPSNFVLCRAIDYFATLIRMIVFLLPVMFWYTWMLCSRLQQTVAILCLLSSVCRTWQNLSNFKVLVISIKVCYYTNILRLTRYNTISCTEQYIRVYWAVHLI